MITALSLRLATAADVPALAALGRDSFVAKFGGLYRPEDLAAFLAQSHAEPVVAAQVAEPTMRIVLAELDGATAGYCKLWLDCAWPEHARGAHAVELVQIYTAAGATGGAAIRARCKLLRICTYFAPA